MSNDESLPDQAATSALKFDKGKPRYDLIPAAVYKEQALLYGMGAEKYGDRNWEAGFDYNRIYRALLSHLTDWWMGEERDQTDHQHHLDSVIWCSTVLRHMQLFPAKYRHLDNRPTYEGPVSSPQSVLNNYLVEVWTDIGDANESD